MPRRTPPVTPRLVLLALIASLGSLIDAAPAAAAGGRGYGAGPVIAFDGEHGLWLGWEAGLAAAGPLLRVSLGGTYRLSSGSDQPRMLHHAVVEPWLILGGTLGLGLADAQLGLVYGLWEGIPLPIEGDLWGGDAGDDYQPKVWVFSIAFGFHGLFGDDAFSLFYFTPKLWRYETVEFNS